MAVFPNAKQEYRGVMNAFWIEPARRDVMGYKLTNVDAGQVIYPGTPIKADDVAKTAVVCKYAYVLAVASDKKTLTVKEGHYIKAGEKVAISTGSGSLTALTVASVSGDDTIKLSAVNNDIKAGDVLVGLVLEEAESGESSASDEYVAVLPNRVVCAVAETNELDMTCSAAHEGIVLQNVVHYPEEYLNKTTFPGTTYLVGCGKIMFTVQ